MLLLLLACAGRAPAPPPPPAAPPPPPPSAPLDPSAVAPGWDTAPLRLTLDDGGGRVHLVEVVCESSGFRQRAPVVDGQADLGQVPRDQCVLFFKGGVPAQFAPVSGGQTLSCRMVATTALCEPLP